MTRTNDRLAAIVTRPDDGRAPDVPRHHCRRADAVPALLPAPLPEALTWSATLDPLDDTHEIEITEEMVSLAIASMEGEQVYPFRREAGSAPPVARTVTRAEVIDFPGR